ncbi:hypothetical protein F4801DRAFT_217584 [Xylaria longipes]|nr:hypothetical protein F4801DRAFT_217584 [Xylaria longipes]
MLYYIDYILKLRGTWDPNNEKTRPPVSDTYGNPSYEHRRAMETLYIVRDDLVLTRVAQEVPEGGPRVTYALPDLPGEAFFAWVCFFNDLFVIRNYLRWCWLTYTQSLDTLTTAALVTNTAIRMIRVNCENLIRVTAHLPSMPNECHVPEWICRGVTENFSPFHHFCHSSWQSFEASWSCYEASFALRSRLSRSYANTRGYKGVILLREQYWRACENRFGNWPTHGAKRELDVGEYIRLFCLSLHNLRVSRMRNNRAGNCDPKLFPCYDEITNGWLLLEPYHDFAHIPLWLVVSLQILVDIREVLGRHSPTALHDFKEYADDMAFIFRNDIKHATTDAQTRDTLQSIENCIRRKNYAKMKIDSSDGDLRVFGNTIRQHMGSICEFFLLRSNPLLCGMQSWWMEERRLYSVSSAVKLHEAILPTALLYIQMRKLGLVSMWHDMEFVIRTRGPEMLPYAPDYWGPYYFPDNTALFHSFNSYFINTDEPPGLRKLCLNSRYTSDLFACYAKNGTYRPNLGVPIEVIGDVVNRVYHCEGWRIPIKHEVCRNDVPNLLSSLHAVTAARHLHDELVSFNWFSMHNTCQKFFDSLKQTLEQNFSAFESKSTFLLSTTIGFTSLGENSKSGSSYASQIANDDTLSLDALYYLVFADDPDRRHENMILASLCLDASEMSRYKIPNREYMTERWADGITRHANKLGISLQSAATVLQRLIVEDGDVNITHSARRLWKRQKWRVQIPAAREDMNKRFLNKRHCWRGPPLHRNPTEAYKPEGWDRYDYWYSDLRTGTR